MKTRRLLACALALALALTACTSSDSKDFQFRYRTKLGTLIPASQRKPAQNIGGKLLAGGTGSLKASHGKVLLLNFWASWCPPCKVEIPQLEQLYRQVHPTGVDFLSVNTKDTREKADNIVAQNHITYPSLYDPNGENEITLGNITSPLPFTILVDKQGRVAAVYVGKLTAVDLERPLHTLAAEK